MELGLAEYHDLLQFLHCGPITNSGEADILIQLSSIKKTPWIEFLKIISSEHDL